MPASTRAAQRARAEIISETVAMIEIQ